MDAIVSSIVFPLCQPLVNREIADNLFSAAILLLQDGTSLLLQDGTSLLLQD